MKIIFLLSLLTSIYGAEISTVTSGDAITATKMNEVINGVNNAGGIIKDNEENPTTCMKLKLKPGTHEFNYVPINCNTKAEIGLAKDGQNIWQLGTGGTKTSCLDYWNSYPSSRTVNGKYIIDADGVAPAFGNQVVYCDMNGGGYTRVVNIINDRSHVNENAVSPNNVADGGVGKLSDLMIRKIMSVEYKLKCANSTLTVGNNCQFKSNIGQPGTCNVNPETTHTGIDGNGIFYGQTGTWLGCYISGIGGGLSGTLWVK